MHDIATLELLRCWKERKNRSMMQRNVFPSEISLNLCFYAGAAYDVKGVKKQTV